MNIKIDQSILAGVAVVASIALATANMSAYADDTNKPAAKAQFFGTLKKSDGEAEVEKARQEAIQKKKKDAEREAEEEARKQSELEELRKKAAAHQAELEAKQKDEAERKAALEEQRKQDARRRAALEERRRLEEQQRQEAAREKEKARQAQLALEREMRRKAAQLRAEQLAEKQREARRLAIQEEKRRRALAARKRARVQRVNHSVHKKSTHPAAIKNIPGPSKETHESLHKHYANWVSTYVGGSIGRASTDGEDGLSIGAVAGKNWQDGKYVYGVEGELSLLNGDDVRGDGLSFSADWMAAVKGRAGYLVRPDTLLYATGGIAFANFDLKHDARGASSETLIGFTIGAGVEHKFDKNWTGRLEYAFTDFGKERVGNGSFEPEIHAIRVSFVYHF